MRHPQSPLSSGDAVMQRGGGYFGRPGAAAEFRVSLSAVTPAATSSRATSSSEFANSSSMQASEAPT